MLVALSGDTGRLLMYEDSANPDWKHKVGRGIEMLTIGTQGPGIGRLEEA